MEKLVDEYLEKLSFFVANRGPVVRLADLLENGDIQVPDQFLALYLTPVREKQIRHLITRVLHWEHRTDGRSWMVPFKSIALLRDALLEHLMATSAQKRLNLPRAAWQQLLVAQSSAPLPASPAATIQSPTPTTHNAFRSAVSVPAPAVTVPAALPPLPGPPPLPAAPLPAHQLLDSMMPVYQPNHTPGEPAVTMLKPARLDHAPPLAAAARDEGPSPTPAARDAAATDGVPAAMPFPNKMPPVVLSFLSASAAGSAPPTSGKMAVPSRNSLVSIGSLPATMATGSSSNAQARNQSMPDKKAVVASISSNQLPAASSSYPPRSSMATVSPNRSESLSSVSTTLSRKHANSHDANRYSSSEVSWDSDYNPTPKRRRSPRLQLIDPSPPAAFECSICLSAPRSILFKPCKHICACDVCGSKDMKVTPHPLTRCPICQTEIRSREQVNLNLA